MKDLVVYIQENQQSTLSEYIIEEGFFDWLKKMWNWMFKTVDKNVKQNKGSYILPKDANTETKSKTPKAELLFAKIDSKKFEKSIIDKTNSKDKSGAFYTAWAYHENNNKEIIYSINDKTWGPMGFQFCKEDGDKLSMTKTTWCSTLGDKFSNEFLSYYVKQFIDWINKKEKKEVVKNEETN